MAINNLKTRVRKFLKQEGFQKYLKNTSWLLVGKFLQITLGLFVSVWVARYLGPENFGLLSYAQSFVGLFAAFATLGLNNIVIRELVKNENRRDFLLGTAFWLKLGGAILVLLLLTIAIHFTDNDKLTNTLIFIIAGGMTFQSFNVIDFYFQSKVISKYIVFANIFNLVFSSTIKILLIVFNAQLIYFAWVFLIDSIVLAIGHLFYYYRNKLTLKKWKFSAIMATKLIKDSWPLILSGILISIYMKIDQVMIKGMLNSEAVGQYAVAVRLSTAWYFIPMLISGSLFPAIINARKLNKNLYYERLQRLYDLLAWIAIAIALPMTFMSDWLINFLYGSQYYQAGGVLMIHIWAGVFVFLGVASSKWFVAENLQKYSLYRTLAGAIVNILLNYLLIPKYGIQGAAYATLISQFVASYFFNIFHKKLFYTFLLQTNALLLPFRKIGIKYG